MRGVLSLLSGKTALIGTAEADWPRQDVGIASAHFYQLKAGILSGSVVYTPSAINRERQGENSLWLNTRPKCHFQVNVPGQLCSG